MIINVTVISVYLCAHVILFISHDVVFVYHQPPQFNNNNNMHHITTTMPNNVDNGDEGWWEHEEMGR